MQNNDHLKAASDTHSKGSTPINRKNLKRPTRAKPVTDFDSSKIDFRADEKLDLAETIKVTAKDRAFMMEKPAVETKSIIGEKDFQEFKIPTAEMAKEPPASEIKMPTAPTEEQLAGEIAYIKNVISAIEGKDNAEIEAQVEVKTETKEEVKEKVDPELKSAIKAALKDTMEAEHRVEVKTKSKKTTAKTPAKAKSKAKTIAVATPKVSRPQSRDNLNMARVNSRMRSRSMSGTSAVNSRLSAKELKDQAIKKALASAVNHTPEKKEKTRIHFGVGRVILALSCAAAVVFAIVYFVNLNMPDMSLKVAAMQTGIDATYPSYIPRGFSITNISSENGKIILNFHNSETNDSFTIEEEKSSWDAGALLTNYVKKNFDEDFSTIREQGLTIYVDNDSAAWVNGGVAYKLNVTSGKLTKKQIRSIAVSL